MTAFNGGASGAVFLRGSGHTAHRALSCLGIGLTVHPKRDPDQIRDPRRRALSRTASHTGGQASRPWPGSELTTRGLVPIDCRGLTSLPIEPTIDFTTEGCCGCLRSDA
eukprot:3267744-Prymnesium_polylepis.1